MWLGRRHARISPRVSRKPCSVRRGEDDLVVPWNFIECGREQVFLLSPSLREWLAEDHLAWFLLDVVEAMGLAEF